MLQKNTDIGTTVSIDPQERYTLSAELTGNGGVVIPENNIVVLGTPKTIYNIKVKDYGDNDESRIQFCIAELLYWSDTY